MRARVTKIIYRVEHDELIVYLFGRFKDKSRMMKRVTGSKPHFYIRDNDVHLIKNHEKVTNIVDDGSINVFRKPLRKVVTRYPFDVPIVRENIEWTYEADVKYNNRISIEIGKYIDVPHDDNNLLQTIEYSEIISRAPGDTIILRQWNIDIETEDSIDAENAPKPITCLTVYDSYDDRFYCLTYLEYNPQKVKSILKSEAEKHGIEPPKKIRIIKCKDEAAMLSKFLQLRNKLGPDVIKGWNVEEFDLEYLSNRNDKLWKTTIDYKAVIVFDLMKAFKLLYNARKGKGRLKSASLEFCANLMLGYGKIKHNESCAQMTKTQSGRNKLLAYNIWDVMVSDQIDQQEKVFEYFDSLSVESNSDGEDWDKPSVQIDMFILNYLYVNGNTKLISKQYTHKRGEYKKGGHGKEKKHGGMVLAPFRGLARKVSIIDLMQAYPSMAKALNCSPETIVSPEEIEELDASDGWKASCNRGMTGTLYWKEPRGVLPTILDYLSKMRNDMRAKMKDFDSNSKEFKNLNMRQIAFKFFMNAFIGVLGSTVFRLSNTNCFNDITLGCQEQGRFIDSVLEKNNVQVIYGDTDGREIIIDDTKSSAWNVKRAESLCKFLNKQFPRWAKDTFNSEDCLFKIKFETLMEYFFQAGRVDKKTGKVIGKKRYAYLKCYEDGEWFDDKPTEERLDIVGFEYVRRNASQITKDLQWFVFEQMFTAGDKWAGIVRKRVNSVIIQILAGMHDNDIGIVIGIQKDHYGKNEIHARAKDFSNKYLGNNFVKGDTIKYFYGWIDGKPKTDVFAVHPEHMVPPEARINYEKMIDLTVRGPLERIFEAMDYTWEQLIMGQKITRQRKLC